jgi:outer membrane protein assembly factor BamB
MTLAQSNQRNLPKPLRLWPGVLAAALMCLVLVTSRFIPGAFVLGMMGGVGGGLLILVWWLLFSRAPWLERVGAIALMAAAVLATRRIVHPSMENAGMGMMLYFFSLPVLSLALVAWAVAARRLSGGARFPSMVAAISLASGSFTLVRTGGVTGDGGSELHWRWTPTPEERLLARAETEPAAPATPPAAAKSPETPPPTEEPRAPAPAPPTVETRVKSATEPEDFVPPPPAAEPSAEWPGFRGPHRDGVVRGVRIETDWSQSPPVELWRQPIGPGWSSFAVQGDLVYTQEQRGEEEDVSCYERTTGRLVWRHRDAARFWESNAGPGPRGTPALANGRVYTLGATGILNALDAVEGTLLWSRNAATDTGEELPGWGFASSPLVVDDVVIVAASGRLAAYDLASGEARWLGPEGGGGYSSPHLVTIDGVPQILLLRGARTTSVAPADGTLLWEDRREPAVSILQPALAGDGEILIASGDMMGGAGIRRIAVAPGPDGWTVEERWTSRGLKPYYNDYVVHEGHAFGFDGSILASIDLKDGQRKWKGGRYGHGQLVLLPDQDLLLVLSEDGELALVGAIPDRFTELARVPAIQGKTWNHPVLAGDVLLVRNGEEMAAFRLALAVL